MAEKIKIEVGSGAPLEKSVTMEIKGRSLIEGIPKTTTVDDSEIREALNEPVTAIVGAIRVALERTPPELSADISDRGFVLAGGGALPVNLDKRIREETSLPVCVADDPVCSVVLGTAKLLEDFKLLRHITRRSGHPWASAAVPFGFRCTGNLDSRILERLALRFERQSRSPTPARIAAGGSGVMSIALARKNPHLQIPQA